MKTTKIINKKIDKNMNEKDNYIQSLNENQQTINNEQNDNQESLLEQQNQKQIKKRGRKPKGGKIIQQVLPLNNTNENKPNIILHLKCFLKDLNTYNLFGSNLEGYDFSNKYSYLNYDLIKNDNHIKNINPNSNKINVISNFHNISNSFIANDTNLINNKNFNNESNDFNNNNENSGNIDKNKDFRELCKKLKQLEHNLHINNICDKKSACFWCTYDFDNPPIYIPKYLLKETYHVYGCFCSPECASAFLMEENIDSSIKFERYYLLNNLYSKIYNYSKNIKPSPKPYYMLDKFYGNLSIQEYRSLLQNERLFLIVDKPLTKILPELHEDNDDFILNNKIIPSNNYNVKTRLQRKKQNKSCIVNEKFGIVSNISIE